MNMTQTEAQDITFETSRFGTITVPKDRVVNFVHGIPGFEGIKRYILIDHDKEGVFKWLQAVDEPAIAFLLTDPGRYKPDYAVPFSKSDIEGLGAGEPKELVSLVMVCISMSAGQVSLNLKGPVVFNTENMSAMQCIIDRDDYVCSYPIKV